MGYFLLQDGTDGILLQDGSLLLLEDGALGIDTTVVAVEATATGVAEAPAVLTGVTVVAVEATATTTAEAATVLYGSTVVAVEAAATATAEAATVSLSYPPVTVTAVEASGSFTAAPPTLFIAGYGYIVAPSASATMSALPAVAGIAHGVNVERRAGWTNPLPSTDPDAAVQFESLTEWTAKLGAGCSVRLDTGQSIPSTTVTSLLWTSAIEDPDNFWDANDPGVLTVPEGFGGVYLASAAAGWVSGGSPTQYRLFIDSSSSSPTNVRKRVMAETSGGAATSLVMPPVRLYLRGGDTVWASVWHNDPSAHVVDAATSDVTFMTLSRIGDWST